jgi:polyribonucleotide nucleotidyltransferase
MHHYSMPPYATGETGRVGSPNRREIGHGALAERALVPVIPGEEKFSYAIRVVSEVMSSNGSTSMASVCGSTLSLMDAGVPLKEPVSGIAMGIVVENEKKYSILTDIMGIEDFNGDMDFKVAGTKNGITALQLDVKTLQLTPAILEKALDQAHEGRLFILDFMLKTLGKPRENVGEYAPKIKSIKIPMDKIGELIGPGGRNIKKISADTGAQIDVNDDGVVFVSATTQESLGRGIESVEAITKVPTPGEIYEGTVKRLMSFGAFVEILPGREGLVHVSDMSEDFVKDPADVVKVDQKVQVRVKGIDEMGRLNLSMMLDPSFDGKKEERRKNGMRGGEGRRGGYSGERRDSFNRGNQRGRDRGGSGGPHFPTSRFLDDKKQGERYRK